MAQITINEGLAWLKTLKTRHEELLALRNDNAHRIRILEQALEATNARTLRGSWLSALVAGSSTVVGRAEAPPRRSGVQLSLVVHPTAGRRRSPPASSRRRRRAGQRPAPLTAPITAA